MGFCHVYALGVKDPAGFAPFFGGGAKASGPSPLLCLLHLAPYFGGPPRLPLLLLIEKNVHNNNPWLLISLSQNLSSK